MFVSKYQTKGTHQWLSRMYTKKESWAASFLSDGFFLGMRSNQRSESINSHLHLDLDFGLSLVQLILHYENAVGKMREREANDDCNATQSTPVAITDTREIEEHAARVFTAANFFLLQADLKKICDLQVFF